MNPVKYIFLDEGGDLNFSPTGSKHFILTSVVLDRPFPLEGELSALRFDWIERGLNLEYFHASEDRQPVRNDVFARISEILNRIPIQGPAP